MKITADELKSRMDQLPDDVLNAICSSDSRYTDDARDAARAVLGRRSASGISVADPVFPVPHPVSHAVDDAVFAPFTILRSFRNNLECRLERRLERWNERILPPSIPRRIRELFWVGLTSALPALTVIIVGFRSVDDVSQVAYELASFSSTGTLAIGISGLVLSYGILTQRTYPRFLAIPFVTLMALWWLRPRRRTGDESIVETSGTIAWTYQTIKYLVKSSEAAAYYDALRMR